jgi:hypothetical protein
MEEAVMPQDDPSRPGGFWQWLRDSLRRLTGRLTGRAEGDGPGNEEHFGTPERLPRTVKRMTTFQFVTPGLGDSYDFAVETECCWCASGDLTEDALQAKIDQYAPVFERVIRRGPRAEARKHLPHRPDVAESALNDAVKTAVENELAATPDLDGVVLNLDVTSQVSIAEPVRVMQQGLLGDRVRAAALLDLSEMYATRLGELRDCWRQFIRDGEADWFTPYAVELAQHPENAAKVLFSMDRQRRADAETFVDRLGTIASHHSDMDLLEFAMATDTALRRTCSVLGIQVPDPSPEPFSGTPPELP